MNKALEYFNEMVSSNQLDYNDEELLIQILFEGDLSSVKEEFANKGYVVVNQYSVPDFGEIFLNVIKVDTLI